jgi:hypothetical protein
MPLWQNLFLIIKGRTLKMGQSKSICVLACLAILLLAMITGCGEHIGENAPVANAGNDFNALVGETATLNGSLSYDADGNPIWYDWSFVSRPQGSNATLSDPSSVTPTFTVDKEGVYVVSLVVTDGMEYSIPTDSVTVTGFICQPGETWDGTSCTDS